MFQVGAKANGYPATQDESVSVPLQVASAECSARIQQRQALGGAMGISDNRQVVDI